jgi:small subunit ribosomal protein S20
MANHASAKKRIRRNARVATVNSDRRNRIRTFIKKVEAAVISGDVSAAEVAFKAAQPELQRGVTTGVFPKNTVARKISRLSARIKAMKNAA